MMLNLPPLLLAPESKTLEFKRDLSSPRNILKTLVAFANSAGTIHLADAPILANGALAHQSEQVSEQVAALLHYCSEQPRSKQELLAVLQLSNAYMNYKRHIVPLLEQGYLALTLPDKPNSRLQRYRLTPQGRTLLEKTFS